MSKALKTRIDRLELTSRQQQQTSRIIIARRDDNGNLTRYDGTPLNQDEISSSRLIIITTATRD